MTGLDHDLSGQIALVTGANRGIGRQISLDLAAAGAVVVLSARNPESLEELSEQIISGGGSCDAVMLDVMDASMVTAVIDDVVSRHGRIDLLVNNAGIADGGESPWALPADAWWKVLEVNVRGPYLCAQAAMRHMQEQKAGRIVDVGSLAGSYPNPNASPYSVSKSALFMWNACLAAGAKEYGVSAFVVSPGLVATDMTDGPQFEDVPADQWVPIEKSGALVVALASGKADVLSGRFIHALDDLDDLVAHADEIIGRNLQTPGLNMLNELF
jgi:NAD(P)-dependent dehydrogenase (short-subunit alcohol dehydrogenase family)